MDEWDQKDWSICDKLGKFGIIFFFFFFFLKIGANVLLQVATEVLLEAKIFWNSRFSGCFSKE